MTERVKEIPAVKQEDGSLLMDLSQEGSPFLEGLLEPVRVVDVRVGPVVYRVPRGADDPTPDNVVLLSGYYHNLTTGKMDRNLESVT